MNSPSFFPKSNSSDKNNNSNNSQYWQNQFNDKWLVAEQPGFSYGFLAIFISLLLGFGWKAFFSPLKIKSRIDQAAQKVHKDFKFEVGEAYFSLSRGIFPEFAIVVNNVKFYYLKNCYFTPEGEVDQIRLPIDIGRLFRGEVEFKKLIIHRLDLRLKEKFQDCSATALNGNSNTTANALANSNSNVNSNVNAPASGSDLENKNSIKTTKSREIAESIVEMKVIKKKYPIQEIQIDMIKVDYWPINGASLRFKDFDLNLKEIDSGATQAESKKSSVHSDKPLSKSNASADYKLLLNSQLSFGSDSQIFETTSKSDLQLVINLEDQKPQDLDLSLRGFWREGNFDFNLNGNLVNKVWQAELNSKYLPLSQIFSVLKKINIMQTDYNGKDIWLTFQSHFKGVANDLSQTQMDVKKLKLEGEIGDIEVPELHIRSLEPLEFSSFEGYLKSVKLENAIRLLGREHPGSTFANLGRLHGAIKVSSLKELEMNLEHSGLELVFSNRGQRRLQTVSLIRGQVKYSKNLWRMEVQDLRPSEGIFDGKAVLSADAQWKNLDFDLKFNELSLDPEVYKLMTSESSVEPFKGDLKVRFINGDLKELKSDLLVKKITVDGVEFNHPVLKFETRKTNQSGQALSNKKDENNDNPVQEIISENTIEGALTARSMMIKSETKIFDFFKNKVKLNKLSEAKELNVKNLNLRFQTNWLKDLNWKLKLDEPGLISQGSWNKWGALQGDLQWKDSGKYTKYRIEGFRDDPRLVEIH